MLHASIKKWFWRLIDSIEIKRLSMNVRRFTARERVFYRILEIVPGALVWGVFIAAIIISFLRPLWAIVFIILFDLLWLLRILYFIIFLWSGWRRYREEMAIDWYTRLRTEKQNFRRYYHLLVFPFYKEPIDVIRHTFTRLIKSHYPLDRLIVVLSGEQRNQEHARSVQEMIRKEFGDSFFRFFTPLHEDQPEEIRGKSANLTFAAREVTREIDALGISYERVIVHAFDSDTRVLPEYFARVTYAYASEKDPTKCSYQPLITFNNNLWESFSFSRVVAYSTTLWHLTEIARPSRLFFTYSSHAISLRALVDVGYWETDMVNEDARLFFQCFIHYQGAYRIVPIFVPVSLDVVDALGVWQTVKNQYKQIRRWGYGVEHFPYLVLQYLKNKKIPLVSRLKHIFFAAEGCFSWATMPILITLLGSVPLRMIQGSDQSSLLAQKAPFILEWIMNVGLVGMAASILLTFGFLPPKPARFRWYKYIEMLLQWVLLPITMTLFGAIPSIDAQTRLMLGKYLGFWSTDKMRK